MTANLPRWIRDELIWPTPIARGSRGLKVQRLQEWLTLARYYLRIDGRFGPATESAVRRFQVDHGLPETGSVDDDTSTILTAPMRQVVEPTPVESESLGGLVVELAEIHLNSNPREVGGQNRGPWVRLYMNGNEGPAWAWCAGFVSFVLEQACTIRNEATPIAGSFSCDAIAIDAGYQGRFVAGRELSGDDVEARPSPGSFFLNRRTDTDWTHIGIVVEALDECFISIEGNTNDDGYREGYEACRRTRGYRDKDFVVI